MSKPVGPYTPIVQMGAFRITSGQIGIDANKQLADDFDSQLRQALANLESVLADGGATKDDVVKTTVFLADIETYARMNELYLEFFGDHRPARSALAVKSLPMGALVEIEAMAYVDA